MLQGIHLLGAQANTKRFGSSVQAEVGSHQTMKVSSTWPTALKSAETKELPIRMALPSNLNDRSKSIENRGYDRHATKLLFEPFSSSRQAASRSLG
jgi:hypothetical protein